MNEHATYQQLREHLAYLKLTRRRRAARPPRSSTPSKTKPGYTQFLHDLLDVEVNATEQRRLAGRLRFAELPVRPRRSRSSTSAPNPSLDRRLVEELATLRFIEEKANVLADRAARRRQDDARDRARPQRRPRRLPRLLHHRRRPRRPHQPRRARGPLADHDALLERPAAADHRRARLPADARRSRRPPLPGHQPPLRTRLDHPDHQPRHRRPGARSSTTPPSPPPSSTASCTTPPSSRSTATATACAATAPASPPSAPASTTPPRVGNSHDRNWGILDDR